MADLSIVELIVYGLIGYTSMLMLIIQVVRPAADADNRSIVRAVWLLPGVIAMLIIATSGDTIVLSDYTNDINQTNTADIDWTETIHSEVALQNSIWILFHLMMGLVMIFYIILQMLTLLTKIK